MKIIGSNGQDRYRGLKFFVEVSADEIRDMTGKDFRDPTGPVGQEIIICEQYQQARAVIRAAEQALQVPDMLRGFAKCFETFRPNLQEIKEGLPAPSESPAL